ncbi:hypothetical protein CM49_03066 [Paenibacillus sp. P1XP2]|nr:hypothetical protein CM49_03066 [Paenibacillus sp. P1XP2]
MSKQIQAYFKTEDDAEQAKTKLIGIETEHLEVGRLGTALEGNRRILLPFAPAGMTGNGVTTGSASAAGVSGAAYTPPVVMSVDDDERARSGWLCSRGTTGGKPDRGRRAAAGFHGFVRGSLR